MTCSKKELKNLVVLYLDLLFLINFIINLLILYTAHKILGLNLIMLRVVLAAALGSLYAVLGAFPGFEVLLTIFPKVIISLMMTLIALPLINLFYYLKYLLVMHLVAFTFGGAILSLGYLGTDIKLSQPAIMMDLPQISFTLVSFGIVITLVLGLFIVYSWQQNLAKNSFLIPITINIDGLEANLIGLVDTGNHLTDPLTGNPVMVVEYKVMSRMLPQQLFNILNDEKELELGELVNVLGGGEWGKRLRIIPFSSIGRDNGVMMGIKPDIVILDNKGRKIINSNVIIGLCRKALCPESSYQALVNPRSVQ